MTLPTPNIGTPAIYDSGHMGGTDRAGPGRVRRGRCHPARARAGTRAASPSLLLRYGRFMQLRRWRSSIVQHIADPRRSSESRHSFLPSFHLRALRTYWTSAFLEVFFITLFRPFRRQEYSERPWQMRSASFPMLLACCHKWTKANLK